MKLYICLLSALLCALHADAFPHPQKDVPPQCIDPTFACQDLQNARLCGVVKECINDIWVTMSVPDDNDEICDICKEMVKEARDQLLSNMTQEEIKEVFEGSCKLLPIKVVADACIKVVDEIIPQLVEMLASRMDPNQVCTISGLCNPISSHESNLYKLLKLILRRGTDTECTECTTMVTDVKKFLKDTPEDKVKKDIENFCDESIPSYLCDIAVDSYFPSIYNYLTNTDAKSVCSSAGVCPKVCTVHEDNKVNDELVCEFCEHVLQHIKDLITANTTAEEFRTALLNFCKHMGSFSDKCTSLVDDYYDMLFDYIRKLDTKGMCTLIGLCTNETCSQMQAVKLIPAKETISRIPLTKLRPAQPVKHDFSSFPLVRLVPESVLNKNQMRESNEVYQHVSQDKFIHPLPIFKKNTECAFCKAVSFFLKKDLKEKSKFGVRAALDGMCDKWVTEYPEECRSFLNKYSVHIQYEIAKGVEIDNLCDSFKACDSEQDKSEIGVRVISKSKDTPFCDLCKDAMTEVENELSNPDTAKKIKNLLDQACKILPDSLRDDCVSFLDSNVDALLDILKQELQPDNFCPAIGLCSGVSRIVVTPRVKDLECDVCKDVVSSLRQKLTDPDTKKVVLVFLEEGCAKLPGSFAQECKTFVDENIDTLLSMIVEKMDPDTVCSILKVCPGSLKKEEPKKFKDIECDLCKEVVGKVEDMVKDKKTEDEIKKALDKVCSLLPKSIAQKCENFVNTYTDLLIELLASEMDPEMICAALNLCPANSQYPVWQSKAQDLECEGCQYALHFLQEQLNNPDTQGEIKNFLKNVCDLLPSKLSQNCEAFVDEYGDSLLALIAQEIDPNSICFELKFCTNQTKLFEKMTSILHPFKMDECSVCTTVVDYLDKLLEEDDVDKEITKLVEKVCKVLPVSYQDKCSSIIETYGTYILQMIGQLADSKEVCQEIDLCSRPPGHVHLIGGHKCTFGPSYWCKSNAHAAACKAENFCKEKVWSN